MLTKLGTELTKEEYVTKYMRNFEKLLLLGDRPKELTNREEQLLQYEKELCVLFYDQFIKKHHRAPDEATLDDQVKANFIERSKIFARAPLITDEANFVQSHIDQIKRVREMRMEDYDPDSYTHVLQREEELARKYFRKHDDYPFGYECLCISRSREVVNQGLEKLLEAFYDSYQAYYRRYRKNG
ncbi:hypothetical protein LIT97_14845 (plasmid) [Enterococcus faecalis]|uniref:hypothetical protein n=1 Tax=Enterococcus TaxID=1350 RepID=UPI001D0BDAB6|nr:hypothetical protein [Enterococcus faecalis]UDM48414.1 hypothetical protein LIT97_14845 [Enterococcus faecalis]